MVQTVADRLRAAQRARFVGRARELEAWSAALASDEPPLLYIHGDGGIGKTTLLGVLADMAEDAGVPAIRVDARAAEGSADAFLGAVGAALAARDGTDVADPLEAMRHRPARALLVDTLELAGGLEPWLRSAFLPALPVTTRVVLAGRAPPPEGMRLDPGWSGRLVALPLAPLDDATARALLDRRGVDGAEAARIAGVAHGHPLALALAADVARQRGGAGAEASADGLERDVLRGLVEAFARDVPDALHRAALHVASLVRVTDEALLRSVVDDARAPALFDWLRSLSFMVHAADGVFPHDLAREVLALEFEQRDTARTRELSRRLRDARLDRLFATDDPEERVRVVLDFLFAGRARPWAKSFFAWRGEQRAYVDRALPADHDAILRLVLDHEGPASRAIAARWLARAPGAFRVFREDATVVAFYAMLDLEERDRDADWDPAIVGAFRHADRHGPLRAGERMLMARFWIVSGAYQEVSPIQDLIQARLAARWFTTKGLAWSFVPTHRHDVWRAQFDALGMPAAEDAAFVVDGRRSTPYAHDWRRIAPRAWLELPAPRPTWREVAARDDAPSTAADGVPAPLDRARFDEAVRDALRDFVRDHALATNALARSAAARARIAAGTSSAEADTSETDAAERVRDMLRDAGDALDDHPRDRKLLRAIDATYFKVARSQEAAAEKLGLAFGTYRRHLTLGVRRLGDLLWARECAARERTSAT